MLWTRGWCLVAIVWAGWGCGSSASPDSPAGGADARPQVVDAGSGPDAAAESEDPLCPLRPPPPAPELSRARQWVRDNPLFVTGLSVSMGAPPKGYVDAYFDEFGATSVHLWEDALASELPAWRAHRPDARWFTWLHQDGTSPGSGAAPVGGYAANEAGRIGFQVGDEPRSLEHLQAIGAGISAVRATDPEALIVINYSHKHAAEHDLLTYADSNIDYDIISYDEYQAGSLVYKQMELMRRHGLDEDRPYWAWLNSYVAEAPHDWVADESDIRWNVFAHATYGFSGYSYFTYRNKHGGSAGRTILFDQDGVFAAAPTSQFAVAAQVNRELMELGRTLSQLTSTDVRYRPFNFLAQPEGTQDWSPGAGGDPYITDIHPDGSLSEVLVGFFEDDYGDVYVMILNPHHSHGSFPVDNDSSQTIRVDFDFSDADACVDRSRLLALDRHSGVVVDLALVDDEGGRAHLDIELEAGEPVLFKYANDVPFARADW